MPVTIGTGGTATLTVATSDDGVNEADGSMTAVLQSCEGYDVGSANSATIAVSDDDDPPAVQSDRIVVSVGSITANGATATWDAVNGAERYMVRWWVSGDLAGTLQYEPVLTNSKDIGGLSAETTSSVEVVAKVNGDRLKARTSLPVEVYHPGAVAHLGVCAGRTISVQAPGQMCPSRATG